jgi:hypothetical protein
MMFSNERWLKMELCMDCNSEKVEKVYESIYGFPICLDCVDYRENMALAKQVKERFEFFNKINESEEQRT